MKKAAATKRARCPAAPRIKQSTSIASRYVTFPEAKRLTTAEWMAEEARITELMRGGNVDRSKSVVEVMRDMRR
ncbi:MAG: hypothetical protein ACKVY0_13775 [Prosthecobacter sp.]|uniref:hypothetical protein n=1 Tax=Prosthecobacter sp. TaxID=1965333 RepID=UPI0038FF1975